MAELWGSGEQQQSWAGAGALGIWHGVVGWMGQPRGGVRGKQGQPCPLGQDTQQQQNWLWMNFLACFSSNLGKENMGWHTPKKGHRLPLCQAGSRERFSSPALPACPDTCAVPSPASRLSRLGRCRTRGAAPSPTVGQPELPSCMVPQPQSRDEMQMPISGKGASAPCSEPVWLCQAGVAMLHASPMLFPAWRYTGVQWPVSGKQHIFWRFHLQESASLKAPASKSCCCLGYLP